MHFPKSENRNVFPPQVKVFIQYLIYLQEYLNKFYIDTCTSESAIIYVITIIFVRWIVFKKIKKLYQKKAVLSFFFHNHRNKFIHNFWTKMKMRKRATWLVKELIPGANKTNKIKIPWNLKPHYVLPVVGVVKKKGKIYSINYTSKFSNSVIIGIFAWKSLYI